MSNSKKIGNSLESKFCSLLASYGYWATILADKISGQPFDVIAAKDDVVLFVDVKNVDTGKSFSLSRIESNQKNSMRMLTNRNVKNVGFAIYFAELDAWKFLPYKLIDFDSKSVKIENLSDLEEYI